MGGPMPTYFRLPPGPPSPPQRVSIAEMPMIGKILTIIVLILALLHAWLLLMMFPLAANMAMKEGFVGLVMIAVSI